MRPLIILILSCSLFTLIYSQNQPALHNPSIEGLYHVHDIRELQQTGLMQKSFTPTIPPNGSVRNIAEFNRMSGVLITYRNGFGIPFALIAEMAEDVLVYTLVSGLSQENAVRGLYQSNGVNLSHCRFIHAATDSYWTRDYGPWFIASDSGEIAIVDFPYNRPRPNDNNIPGVIANALGINLYGMNLVHTGGNYMTDGMGISASTTLVSSENANLSTAQINQMVQDYLGIHTYHLNTDPLGQYIQHIDCWGKFLDVDKILIGEVPASDPRYIAYEAVASYYATSISSYGTPFQVFRTYSPNGQPYTNSLILNNKVLVPIVSGASASLWNAPALAVYQQAMPGYEIIGVSQSSQAPWQSTDALHCRTKGMADIRMLHIHHVPLIGDIQAQPSFEIRAEVRAYADSGLMVDSILLIYQVNGNNWDSIPMIPDTAHTWVCHIPGQLDGSVVSYAIMARDSTGRKEFHPFIGLTDPHTFTVIGYVGQHTKRIDGQFVKIYPNPASDLSFCKFTTSTKGDVSLFVFDLSGRMVFNEIWSDLGPGEQFVKLDVNSWNAGTYLLRIQATHEIFSGKLIVIK